MSHLPSEVEATLRWIAIRMRHGHGLREDFRGLVIDAEHSPLLSRLLNGVEPHEVPPPKRYSYPWYDLIEAGRADDVMEAWEWKPTMGLPVTLIIDQGSWDIIEKTAAEWIVTYTYSVVEHGTETKVQHPGRWSVTSGSPKPHMKWTIARLV